jgi:hypothetical protein
MVTLAPTGFASLSPQARQRLEANPTVYHRGGPCRSGARAEEPCGERGSGVRPGKTRRAEGETAPA